MPKKPVYALRTCNADMTSRDGFQWPKKGKVKAPDWKDTYECGNGLHGLLWGAGDALLLHSDPDAKWLVVKITSKWIDLNGKIKFPACEVVFCGTKEKAIQKIAKYAQESSIQAAIVYSTSTAGDEGTATAGDEGTATAGYKGTATAGYYGTATAGAYGTATAGAYGTATAGYKGTATAGDEGLIQIVYWDQKKEKYIFKRGFIGEKGLKPNTPYQVINNRFKEVKN